MQVDNSQDIIDSRDVIARIEELQALFLDEDELGEDSVQGDEDEREELRVLLALQDEAEGYAADWRYGEALIRDSYFTDYARELAEDIGAVDPAANWPLSFIDWDAAADALAMDYTEVDFDGVTYLVRS